LHLRVSHGPNPFYLGLLSAAPGYNGTSLIVCSDHEGYTRNLCLWRKAPNTGIELKPQLHFAPLTEGSDEGYLTYNFTYTIEAHKWFDSRIVAVSFHENETWLIALPTFYRDTLFTIKEEKGAFVRGLDGVEKLVWVGNEEGGRKARGGWFMYEVADLNVRWVNSRIALHWAFKEWAGFRCAPIEVVRVDGVEPVMRDYGGEVAIDSI
jgi:hypothetical protein